MQVRSDGPRRLYSLRPEPFQELDAWLASYRSLWEKRLDRFGHFSVVCAKMALEDARLDLATENRERIGATNLWAMRSGGNGESIVRAESLLPNWSQIPERIQRQVDISRREMARLHQAGEQRNVTPSLVFEQGRGWPLLSMRTTWDGGLQYLPNPGLYQGDSALPHQDEIGGILLSSVAIGQRDSLAVHYRGWICTA